MKRASADIEGDEMMMMVVMTTGTDDAHVHTVVMLASSDLISALISGYLLSGAMSSPF